VSHDSNTIIHHNCCTAVFGSVFCVTVEPPISVVLMARITGCFCCIMSTKIALILSVLPQYCSLPSVVLEVAVSCLDHAKNMID